MKACAVQACKIEQFLYMLRNGILPVLSAASTEPL